MLDHTHETCVRSSTSSRYPRVHFMSSLVLVLLAQATATPPLAAAPALAAYPLLPDDSTADATRELNRVVYLRGGGSVRARARRVDGGWEVRSDGQWTRIEDAVIDRVLLERDVLAQARELSRKLDPNDPASRVPYADWLFRAGLYEEALIQLDETLEASPDQPQALALLAKLPVPMRAPGATLESVEEAIRAGAGSPRALQELSIASLARRDASLKVGEALQKALGSHSPRIRAFAALGLRRIEPGRAVKELLGRAVLDGSSEVRREAALTLKATGEEAVALPVLRALGSPNSGVRENAIDALGVMGFRGAVEPLVARVRTLSSPQGSGGAWKAPASHIFVGRQFAYVQDYDVEVAQFAAVADPQVNTAIEGAVLDVRVIGVHEMTFAVESRKLRLALRQLTGENPGDTNKAWLAWWDQHGARFRATPEHPKTAGDA